MAERIETMVPGNVWKVLVKPGDRVSAGDVLFILEVMKTEVPHASEQGGIVKAVHIVEAQEGVDAGTLAVEIE
jgi:biotin carboxyl carrier protein